MLVTYEDEFLTSEGKLVPIFYFEEDNAKGCRDKSARFCLVIFADILGVDYVDDASNVAGSSKFHSIEGVWGATRHRTGGAPIMLDISNWDAATSDEKIEASEKALAVLMRRYDECTFKAGGGLVNANVAGSIPTDWEFRNDEIKEFIELNPGPGFNGFATMNQAQLEFVAKPMHGFDGNPSDVYRRAWRKMTATSERQCFFLCLNSMTYAANPLHVDCGARRAPPAFWTFLQKFSTSGLEMPQGVPSKKRVGKLMRLDERLALAASTALKDNAPDAHHPVKKFAEMDAEMNFVEMACAGVPMSKKHTEVLKGSGKKALIKAFVRKTLCLADVTRTLKSGKKKTRPATVNRVHLLQTLVVLGVSTGKKNREVTEAHVPKLMQFVYEKANLSTTAPPAAAPPLATTVELPAVAPDVAAEAELSEDDEVSDDELPDDEVDNNDNDEEKEDDEDVDDFEVVFSHKKKKTRRNRHTL